MGNTMKTTRAPEETSVPNQAGQESDFLAVLYDYPSPDIGEPIFQVGEKLRVLSDEGGWWRVHSLTTGRENYIPGKHVAKVYHGWLFEGLGREKAEELLQLPNTKFGSFMIRESETRKGLYSLSVRHTQVKHYRIFRMPNNWYYISPRQTFQCLEDLVNHYSEVADGLCCILTTPCLTQCANNSSARTQADPVIMRNKNFSWRNMHRLQMNNQESESALEMDDSCLSFGLRESIASYLSLAGEDNSSFRDNRKKKTQSLIYTGNKRKNNFHFPTLFYDD
ncbi:src-like-adapter [Alligator mississippiensis]|uniref:Src-like-adapter n=1 Tax=Alligator mississippiensis TaxID=8496 RepID=A0A151P8A7_ALLMI|nr:src-like-adapter [Alligator mississippiensis]KYO45210.1 src-like-adapter [Alligator mississippiensis]